MNHFLVSIIKSEVSGRFCATLRTNAPEPIHHAVASVDLRDLVDMVVYTAKRRSYDAVNPKPVCPTGECGGYGYVIDSGKATVCPNPCCQEVLNHVINQSVSFDASSEVAPETAAILNNY